MCLVSFAVSYAAGGVIMEYQAKLLAVKAAQGHGTEIHKELCAAHWGCKQIELVEYASRQNKRLYISYYN